MRLSVLPALHLLLTPSVMFLAFREQNRLSNLRVEDLFPTLLFTAREHVFAGAPALIQNLIKLLKMWGASRTYANPSARRLLLWSSLHLQKQIIIKFKKALLLRKPRQESNHC